MLVEGGQCLVEVRDPLLDLLHYFLLFELLLLLDQVLEVEAALQLADVPEDYPSQLFEVVPFLIRITALEFGQEASPFSLIIIIISSLSSQSSRPPASPFDVAIIFD